MWWIGKEGGGQLASIHMYIYENPIYLKQYNHIVSVMVRCSFSCYCREAHSNHMTSSKWADTLICHTTMRRNAINFLHNPGHMTLWCLEVVLVVYARVAEKMWMLRMRGRQVRGHQGELVSQVMTVVRCCWFVQLVPHTNLQALSENTHIHIYYCQHCFIIDIS